MTEIIKIWLTNMYEENIEETKVAISNERLWAKAATSTEETEMHMNNIANMEEYIEVLKEKIAEI